LQFATSDPKGPVYIAGAREVIAEVTEPYSMDTSKYVPIGPSALPDSAVETIAESLLKAKSSLIVTGYSGRNHSCPAELAKLADNVPGLRVLDTGGCDMCFPATHPSSLGFRLSFDQATTNADIIFVLDCDIPWIPSCNKPREDALIYHVDVDPLNSTMDISFFPAHGRWKADSYTALTQINRYLNSPAVEHLRLPETEAQKRHDILVQQHEQRMSSIDKLANPGPSGLLDIHYVGSAIKNAVPGDAVLVVEAATCAMSFSDQLKAEYQAVGSILVVQDSAGVEEQQWASNWPMMLLEHQNSSVKSPVMERISSVYRVVYIGRLRGMVYLC
jgi:thiamine pyrophosphate-dependent acetolactate synthase large subunit-like protein